LPPLAGASLHGRSMKKKSKDKAPHIETPGRVPPPHRQFSPIEKTGIVLRNVVPLLGVLFFGHSAGHFVLLCVFNLALTIAGIGVVGIAVSQHGNYVGNADRLAGACSLLVVGLGIAAMLTGLFGWAIAVFIDISEHSLFDRELFWSALSILLCALPEAWRQYSDDVHARLDEAQRKRRDQPIVFVHLLSAGLIFVYTPYAFGFGAAGVTAAAIAITAMFIFRDLHPDRMRRLAPPARLS